MSSAPPDRSPEAIAKRKKATDQARAANIRAGYTFDLILEEATADYVAGSITLDEYRARVMPKPKGIRHPDDYTALSNWMVHDQVQDTEISALVLQLADRGLRVSEIEELMKNALKERLSCVGSRRGTISNISTNG